MMMFKILRWILVGAGALLFLISVLAFFIRPGEPPSIEKAPFVIQTYSTDGLHVPSRVYYGEGYKNIEGVPMLTGYWWSYDGEKYKKHSGDKPFPFDEYGTISVKRR